MMQLAAVRGWHAQGSARLQCGGGCRQLGRNMMPAETYSNVRSTAFALDSMQLVAVQGQCGLFEHSLLMQHHIFRMVHRQSLVSCVTVSRYKLWFMTVRGVDAMA
jgi:hypothetical protein